MDHYDILIIDDEEGIRDVMADLVHLSGYTFATAADAAEAVVLLEKRPHPYLIFCDISMPGMTGLELIQHIRTKGFHSSIILLTAHSESDKIIEALQLGAIDYIVKPFDTEVLFKKIPGWVEIGKRFQELHENDPTRPITDLSKQLRMIELFRLKAKGTAEE